MFSSSLFVCLLSLCLAQIQRAVMKDVTKTVDHYFNIILYIIILHITTILFPVKHLAQEKILQIMAVNYCGRQLAQSLRWAAPAYRKKEGDTPHPGACKFIMQYDGMLNERFGVRVWRWNLGSLSGKGGEVCE